MPQPDPIKPVDPEKLQEGLEEDLKGKIDPAKAGEGEEGDGEKGAKVPFHQDPEVQLYIERQVAKRVGEGNTAWEERLARLESRLTEKKTGQDWTPANEAEAKAAQAIIDRAKREAKQEFMSELSANEQKQLKQQEADDKAFGDWLEELKVVGTLKTEDDQKAFASMIVEYGLEDKQKAVALWGKLQGIKTDAKAEGEVEGIKKAQEAKIGSGRKGGEPGAAARSYQQRRAEEPSFDAIRDRELRRLQEQ